MELKQFQLELDSAQMLSKPCENLKEKSHIIRDDIVVKIMKHNDIFQIFSPKKTLTDTRKDDNTYSIEQPKENGKKFFTILYAADFKSFLVKRLVTVLFPINSVEKIKKYLQRMNNVLCNLMDVKSVTKVIAKKIIKIEQLTYISDCTIYNPFIILTQSQDTTKQMIILLTLIRFKYTVIVTGDTNTLSSLAKYLATRLRKSIKIPTNVRTLLT